MTTRKKRLNHLLPVNETPMETMESLEDEILQIEHSEVKPEEEAVSEPPVPAQTPAPLPTPKPKPKRVINLAPAPVKVSPRNTPRFSPSK